MLKTSYEPHEVEFIKENYLKLPIKKIARDLNRSYTGVNSIIKRLGLKIPNSVVKQRVLDSRIKKGNTPPNKGKKQEEYMSKEAIERSKKTRFKKGVKPHNTKKAGHERVTKDGYVYVKTEKNIFELKHVVEWEKKHGKIKEGYILRNIDGNPKNTNPDNWSMILLEENMLRNSKFKSPEEIIKTQAIVSKLKNTVKKIEHGTK